MDRLAHLKPGAHVLGYSEQVGANVAQKWDDLQQLSDEQVAKEYDKQAQYADPGVGFWRDELARRSADKQAAASVSIASSSKKLAIAAVVLSAVSTVATLATPLVN